MKLKQQNVVAYLSSLGYVNDGEANWAVEPLPGGLINSLFRAWGPSSALVVKQAGVHAHAIPGLYLDPSRIKVEYEAIRVFRRWFPQELPEPVFFDEEHHILVLQSISPDARQLKADLIAGNVDMCVAHRIGEISGRIHDETSRLPDVLERLANTEMLMSVKIHLQAVDITTDRQLHSRLETVTANSLRHRSALLHGDLCPKNILVHGSQIFLLDLEEAHFGDPALELGYFLAHYLLEALAHPQTPEPYIRAAAAARSSYLAVRGGPVDTVFDERVSTFIGVFLLSRITSRAPAAWITDSVIKQRVARLAETIIYEEGLGFDEVVGLIHADATPQLS